MFQIFERINTSGKILKSQEIRNCVYQGNLNKLLFKLNSNETWRALYGNEEEDSRMSDLEFILRFFALAQDEIKNKNEGQISLKLFLNDFMGNKENNKKAKIEALENDFINTITQINNFIGINAFKNINVENIYLNRFHPTIFDSVSIATNYAIKRRIDISSIQNLAQKHIDLLNNLEFKEYSSNRTTNLENINGRINLACQILFGISYE